MKNKKFFRKNILTSILLTLLMVSFGTAYSQCGGGHNHSKSSSTKSVDNNDVNAIKDSTKTYTCSMHPEVISDKPGKCPKCGMELILKNSESTQNMNMGCMGMMHGEKGKHKGMMYVAGGVIMVAMMATFMFLRFN